MDNDTSFDAVDKKTRRSRKKREAALILPTIGIILLLTPVLKAFTLGETSSPLTSTMIFIFTVWALLIVAAFILSQILIHEVRDE